MEITKNITKNGVRVLNDCRKNATLQKICEAGSEIVQLVFVMPILIVLFGLAVQLCLWIFSTVQFSQACELVANNTDVNELCDAGITSERASKMIADEISANMIGVSADDIEVSNVSITDKKDKYANGESVVSNGVISLTPTDPTSYSLVQSESNATLNFSASYVCRNVVDILGENKLNFTISRNRLLSRITEVRENA